MFSPEYLVKIWCRHANSTSSLELVSVTQQHQHLHNRVSPSQRSKKVLVFFHVSETRDSYRAINVCNHKIIHISHPEALRLLTVHFFLWNVHLRGKKKLHVLHPWDDKLRAVWVNMQSCQQCALSRHIPSKSCLRLPPLPTHNAKAPGWSANDSKIKAPLLQICLVLWHLKYKDIKI